MSVFYAVEAGHWVTLQTKTHSSDFILQYFVQLRTQLTHSAWQTNIHACGRHSHTTNQPNDRPIKPVKFNKCSKIPLPETHVFVSLLGFILVGVVPSFLNPFSSSVEAGALYAASSTHGFMAAKDNKVII